MVPAPALNRRNSTQNGDDLKRGGIVELRSGRALWGRASLRVPLLACTQSECPAGGRERLPGIAWLGSTAPLRRGFSLPCVKIPRAPPVPDSRRRRQLAPARS